MNDFPFSKRTEWSLTPNPLSEAIEKMQASKVPILDLTASNPTECGFQYPQEWFRMLDCVQAKGYHADSKGLLSARKAVSAYYQQKGIVLDPSHVLLTASTSEAYSFLFKLLTNAGDHVLIPGPSYPLFQFLLELHDVHFDTYPLVYDKGQWKIDRERFSALISSRTRAVVIVNPNNPTCSYISDSDKDFLNEICVRQRMAIISDEVFLDYPLEEQKRGKSILDNDRALTFVLSGVSKILGMPQMKLSWIAVNGPQASLAQAVERLDIIADTYLSVNGPVQLAMPGWMIEREHIQRQILERVRANLSFLRTTSLRTLDVEAGWYAVVEAFDIQDEEAFVLDLLITEQVLVHPGYFFDFEKEGYLVLSLLAPEDVFRKAVERIIRKKGLL